MLAFYDFHIEVKGASLGIGTNCSISGVGQRTALAVAKTCDVVLIAAEVFLLGGSFISRVSKIVFEGLGLDART